MCCSGRLPPDLINVYFSRYSLIFFHCVGLCSPLGSPQAPKEVKLGLMWILKQSSRLDYIHCKTMTSCVGETSLLRQTGPAPDNGSPSLCLHAGPLKHILYIFSGMTHWHKHKQKHKYKHEHKYKGPALITTLQGSVLTQKLHWTTLPMSTRLQWE